MPVAELASRLVKLRGQLPLRRRVDRAAVLVEEQVEQPVDGSGSLAGGQDVASSERPDLVEEAVEELGRFGAGRATVRGGLGGGATLTESTKEDSCTGCSSPWC
jgi:hypothetical protein